MVALEREFINKDWITFIFLFIGFSLIVIKFLDKERLKQIFALPYNTLYFTNYENISDPFFKPFNILFFLISNLILGLLLYLVFQNQQIVDEKNISIRYSYVLGYILLYWIIRYLVGVFVAWLFDLKELHKNAVYVKMTYFFSIHLYIIFPLIFAVYYFDWRGDYIKFVLLIYGLLLVLRYFRFIYSLNNMTFVNLLYFILYICTLEIAPLILIYKWVL